MLGSFRLRSQPEVLRRRYLRPQRFKFFQPRNYRMSSVDLSNSQYLADPTTPLCSLNVAEPFKLLTSQEKHYAHWVGQAGWAGTRIIQEQWTPYGSDLYDLLIATFSNGEKPPGLADLNALQAESELDNDEWDAMLNYTVQVCLQLTDDNRAFYTVSP
jgi:dipeptidyl-peptidase III